MRQFINVIHSFTKNIIIVTQNQGWRAIESRCLKFVPFSVGLSLGGVRALPSGGVGSPAAAHVRWWLYGARDVPTHAAHAPWLSTPEGDSPFSLAYHHYSPASHFNNSYSVSLSSPPGVKKSHGQAKIFALNAFALVPTPPHFYLFSLGISLASTGSFRCGFFGIELRKLRLYKWNNNFPLVVPNVTVHRNTPFRKKVISTFFLV